jgi:hypothetical protein
MRHATSTTHQLHCTAGSTGMTRHDQTAPTCICCTHHCSGATCTASHQTEELQAIAIVMQVVSNLLLRCWLRAAGLARDRSHPQHPQQVHGRKSHQTSPKTACTCAMWSVLCMCRGISRQSGSESEVDDLCRPVCTGPGVVCICARRPPAGSQLSAAIVCHTTPCLQDKGTAATAVSQGTSPCTVYSHKHSRSWCSLCWPQMPCAFHMFHTPPLLATDPCMQSCAGADAAT